MHIGALGWNGGLTFAMLYCIVPRIYGTTLYSVRLANTHFWMATLGMLFYAIPLYIAGITQALMWKEFTPDGVLRYGNFLETVRAHPADVLAARRRRHDLPDRRADRALQPLPDRRVGRVPARRGGAGRRRCARCPRPRAAAWHRALEGRPTPVRAC